MTDDDSRMKAHAARRFIAPIEQAELAVRMMEAALQARRPPGQSAEAIMHSLSPENREFFAKASMAAMEYFKECVLNAQEPS